MWEPFYEKKTKIDCCCCKFFDGTCCMYKCKVKAIFDTEDSAKNCEHYFLGHYNQIELEKSNYTGSNN